MGDSTSSLAIVLPVTEAASMEPQVLGGVRGRWFPGQPYALAALDLKSEAEARAFVRGTPLQLVSDAEQVDGEFPAAVGHSPFSGVADPHAEDVSPTVAAEPEPKAAAKKVKADG